jgi:allene oxide cyclase
MKEIAFIAALAVCASPALAADIHVVEHATSDATAHIASGADNRGDILTFNNEVFDASDKAKVGSDQGFCVRIVTGKSFECMWTLMLADGQITVEGPFHDAGDTILAVTGGTGKYAGAKGEMKLHARNAKGTAYDFIYSLR